MLTIVLTYLINTNKPPEGHTVSGGQKWARFISRLKLWHTLNHKQLFSSFLFQSSDDLVPSLWDR